MPIGQRKSKKQAQPVETVNVEVTDTPVAIAPKK